MSEPDFRAREESLGPQSAHAVIEQTEALIYMPSVRKVMDKQATKVEKDLNPRTGSQQLESDAESFAFFDVREEIVEPPINMRLWAAQLARSTRLNRGIRTTARNTVGIGFNIIPAKPFNDETPEEEKTRVLEAAARVEEFFLHINPDTPFETLMECVVVDEEATGNGYLEFTRLGAGKLDKAFHVPSVTVRILRRDRGFVQIRGGRKRFFKRFGEEKVMDARNGKFQGEPGFGKAGVGDTTDFPGTIPLPGEPQATEPGSNAGEALPIEHRATEILHFKLYHPMSDVYGIPRFISAGAAIAGNWLSSKRNVVFFKNDAVPRMAILVTGGKLDQRSRDDLAAYLQEGQGEEQAHRILILQAEEEGIGMDGKSTTKLDLKPFTVGVTEDGSFLNYRVANDEEIREVFGLSEVFFKSNKLTKASAVVAKATTDEQEFEPARKQKEYKFNHQIMWGDRGLGETLVRFEFQRPNTTDPQEQAEIDKMYSDSAVLTPNEIRRKLGMDPHPPEQEWANWPLPVLLLALENKAVGELIDRDKLGPLLKDEAQTLDDNSNEPPAADGDDEDDKDDEDEPADDKSASSDPVLSTKEMAAQLRQLLPAAGSGNLSSEVVSR